MNEKVAKRLRKIARTIATDAQTHNEGVALPYVKYDENELNRKSYQAQARGEQGQLLTNEDGTPKMAWYQYAIGTLTLTEDCVRGIYVRLKQEYSAGLLTA